MKLTAYLSVLVILAVLAISLSFGLTSPHRNTPQFKQTQPPAALTYISYDFLNRRPFEGGKMWIHTASGGAKSQVFIYDIENRHVLGEVTNCWPAMLFGEPLKLLCYQPTPATAPSGLKQRLLNFVARISRGRYFSIPRFYRDSVIYVRSNSLWQVSLDGVSHVGVFPPAEAPEQTRQ